VRSRASRFCFRSSELDWFESPTMAEVTWTTGDRTLFTSHIREGKMEMQKPITKGRKRGKKSMAYAAEICFHTLYEMYQRAANPARPWPTPIRLEHRGIISSYSRSRTRWKFVKFSE